MVALDVLPMAGYRAEVGAVGKLPIRLTKADLELLALALREAEEALRQKQSREREADSGEA